MSTSKYLGHEALISYLHEQDNYSYRGFLGRHRDIIIISAFSNHWRELDNTWFTRFLEEAEKLFDKKDFTDLTKKVALERRGNGLQTYWNGVIVEQKKKRIEIEEEKENIVPTSSELRKKRKKQRQTYKTELEVLSTIPPPIYYPDLDKCTTTTKSTTARKPFPVESWTSFLDEVQSYELDDKIKQYPRPSFKTYDKSYDISNEEDVRGALKNNIFDNLHIITTSQQQIEFFKRISKEDNVKGDPDFIYKNINELLIIIEVKTLWVLYLEDSESLHEKYKEDLRRKECETISLNSGRKISVVGIIHQIFGYLVVNELQYGILSTYNQHWFLRRPKEESRVLKISPTVDIRSQNPQILKCYTYLQHLSRTDAECPSPGTTPSLSPRSSLDDESPEDNTSDSDYEDYEETSKQKRKRNSKGKQNNSASKKSCQ
ncbi:2617_t:CDS:2 [Diversispora eburnea]|uniref:2617_t:CDS:1 n=1 Tax=Diversispora eburnea TaxID=1213867 RepID=A0A9N9CF95_9GLOM|nr:2617_t:CDS:2 [Diversispora eburnea]